MNKTQYYSDESTTAIKEEVNNILSLKTSGPSPLSDIEWDRLMTQTTYTPFVYTQTTPTVYTITETNSWTPTLRDLPTKDGVYMVTWESDCGEKDVTIERWFASQKEWSTDRCCWEITAWRPLPKPYERC